MTIERSGRYEPTANVRHMRWAENPGDERRDGIRVGYGRAFCFIPEDQAVNLATLLVDYIDANGLTHNNTADTGN